MIITKEMIFDQFKDAEKKDLKSKINNSDILKKDSKKGDNLFDELIHK